MEVSKLVKSQKSGLIQVFVDDKYLLSLSIDTIIKYAITKGTTLTKDKLEEIIEFDLNKKFLFLALKQIGKRPRSKREIEIFLNKKAKARIEKESLQRVVVNNVIKKLEQDNYINDYDFAVWWINNRLDFKGKSKIELQKELLMKGVSKDVINEALNNLLDEGSEGEIVKRIIRKKFRNINLNDESSYQKVVNYFTRRGFDYFLVRGILESIENS